jgi:hypothetical protein
VPRLELPLLAVILPLWLLPLLRPLRLGGSRLPRIFSKCCNSNRRSRRRSRRGARQEHSNSSSNNSNNICSPSSKLLRIR